MKEKDIKENTKFWLKFAAGSGSNKQSSILAINLPTCTTIVSAALYKQISKTWEGDNVMEAIPSALPKGPDESTTTKGILKPMSPTTKGINNNKTKNKRQQQQP